MKPNNQDSIQVISGVQTPMEDLLKQLAECLSQPGSTLEIGEFWGEGWYLCPKGSVSGAYILPARPDMFNATACFMLLDDLEQRGHNAFSYWKSEDDGGCYCFEFQYLGSFVGRTRTECIIKAYISCVTVTTEGEVR